MNHPKSKLGLKPTFCKILVFAIAFLLPALPVHATSEPGTYVTFTGSIDMFEDMTLSNQDGTLSNSVLKETDAFITSKNGLGFNHSIGYRFRNSLSTELEFSYKNGEFDKAGGSSGGSTSTTVMGDVTTKSLLLNGIYSFDIRKFYTPYIGYGIGVAFHEGTLQNFSNGGEDKTYAYQLKMGVDMEFSRKLSLLLGYRYFNTDEANLTFFTGETTTHSLEAGVKFHF